MANIKSSIKDITVSAKRAERNKSITSGVKSAVRKAEKAVATGSAGAKEAVMAGASALDKAVGKGILHPNNAARRKSRLQKKLNKIATK